MQKNPGGIASMILLAALCLPLSKLWAQPAFKSGDIFVDLSLGAGRAHGASVDVLLDANLYQLETLVNVSSSNTERRNLGLLQLGNLETPRASSVSGRLGFEYAFGDWFGFGVSLNSLKAKVTAVPVSTLDRLGFLLYVSPSFSCSSFLCPDQAPGVTEYLSLQTESIDSPAYNTLDFDFNFHIFTTEVFDPYIRLTIGLGQVEDLNLAKVGLAIGTRYMVSGRIYLMGEIAASTYSIVLSESESGSGSRTAVSSLSNDEIRLGVGYKF